MNWDAIGAISELIGALAVVASLIYLSVQIRQNTRQVHEQTRSHQLSSLASVGQLASNFRVTVSGDRQVAAVWLRGTADLSQLEDDERKQFDLLAADFFWALAMMKLYARQGVFEQWAYDHSRFNTLIYAGPGLFEWWQSSPHRHEFPPEFIPDIDEVFTYPVGARPDRQDQVDGEEMAAS